MQKTLNFGGREWTILDRSAAKLLVIAKEPIGSMQFSLDHNNNWKESSLRKHLNTKFLEELEADGADLSLILDTESDLVADDGTTAYGKSVDKVSLLSHAQYVTYRDKISPAKDYWLLLTPISTLPNYSSLLRHVTSDGALFLALTSKDYLIRPLLTLKSSILHERPTTKVKLLDLQAGDTIDTGAGDFTLLEHFSSGVTLVLATSPITQSTFADAPSTNYWGTSFPRQLLNKGLLPLLQMTGLKPVEHSWVLTDTIGKASHWICRSKIGLLSVKQYTKYADIIPASEPYWLITPCLPFEDMVYYVTENGEIGQASIFNTLGVRPAFYLDSASYVTESYSTLKYKKLIRKVLSAMEEHREALKRLKD